MRYEDSRTRFYVYNNAGDTHLAADLAGYFWVPRTPCTSGCAYVWGPNNGYLGVGTTNSASRPTALALSNVVRLSGQYAVLADGTVWGWGQNSTPELGTDWVTGPVPMPVRVSGLSGMVAVAGGSTGYALRGDGTGWAWGTNLLGALGNGADCLDCVSTGPMRVVDLTGAVDVDSHGAGAHVLDSTGRIWAWGSNQSGALGTLPFGHYRTRPGLVPGLTGVTDLAAGGRVLVPNP